MTDKRIEAAASRLACVSLGNHFLTHELAKSVLAAADAVGFPLPLRFNETTGEIETLSWQQEKQELIEALRFYADKENYRPSQNLRTALLQRYMSIVEFDDGQRAREVLAKHGGE